MHEITHDKTKPCSYHFLSKSFGCSDVSERFHICKFPSIRLQANKMRSHALEAAWIPVLSSVSNNLQLYNLQKVK